MKQVAPLPSPCPNWTGFYLGMFGGYKFGAIDNDLSMGGDWDFHPEGRNVGEVQYQYIDLGDIDFNHRSGGSLGNFIGNSAASLREHQRQLRNYVQVLASQSRPKHCRL